MEVGRSAGRAAFADLVGEGGGVVAALAEELGGGVDHPGARVGASGHAGVTFTLSKAFAAALIEIGARDRVTAPCGPRPRIEGRFRGARDISPTGRGSSFIGGHFATGTTLHPARATRAALPSIARSGGAPASLSPSA